VQTNKQRNKKTSKVERPDQSEVAFVSQLPIQADHLPQECVEEVIAVNPSLRVVSPVSVYWVERFLNFESGRVIEAKRYGQEYLDRWLKDSPQCFESLKNGE